MGVGKVFINKTPNTQATTPKMDKWEYVKLKGIYKDTVTNETKERE